MSPRGAALAVLIAFLAALAVAGPAAGSWTHDGGSAANLGATAFDSALSPQTIANANSVWSHEGFKDGNGEHDTPLSGPVVSDGMLFATYRRYSAGFLEARDTADGSVEWTAPGAAGRPVAYGRRVWVPESSSAGDRIAVYPTRCGTGGAVCVGRTFATLPNVKSVTVTATSVLAVTRTGSAAAPLDTLLAFDRSCVASCPVRWRYKVPARLSDASAAGGLAWVGRSDNRIAGLPLDCDVPPGGTCAPTQRRYVPDADAENFSTSAPAVAGSRLYITSSWHTGRLYAFPVACDTSLCRPLWRSAGEDRTPPTVYGGRIWVASIENGDFYTLEAYSTVCRPVAGVCSPRVNIVHDRWLVPLISAADGLIFVPTFFDKSVLVFDHACQGDCQPLKTLPLAGYWAPDMGGRVAVSGGRAFVNHQRAYAGAGDEGGWETYVEAFGLPAD